MLPGTDTMPSAGRAGVPGPGLDEVLEARPDLAEPLGRALRDLGDSFSLENLARYLSADEEAYAALTVCAAAAYYLSPEVRDQIGYPGQEARSFDPYEYVGWIDEGLLDPVTERGPIWRRPPGDTPAERGRAVSRSGPAVLLEDYGAGPRLAELEAARPGRVRSWWSGGGHGVRHRCPHRPGHLRPLGRLPLVMGHEGCGRIVELGPGARADAAGAPLAPGDLIVWAHNWCGACYYCAVARQPTLCANTMGYGWGPYGGRLNGTFSRYLHVAAESRVLRVPGGVSPALASSSTCALRTVMHALDRLPPIRFGHTAVVLGAGPVGLYAAAAATAAGAHQTVPDRGPRQPAGRG